MHATENQAFPPRNCMVLAESTNLAFILFSQYKPLGLKMQLNF